MHASLKVVLSKYDRQFDSYKSTTRALKLELFCRFSFWQNGKSPGLDRTANFRIILMLEKSKVTEIPIFT